MKKEEHEVGSIEYLTRIKLTNLTRKAEEYHV